jgi:predicted permease
VISHTFWLSHFNASPSAVGSALRINRVVFTVIGVAAEDFHGTQTGLDYQIWLPLTMYGQVTHTGDWMLLDRKTRNFTMLGRLKPGVTVGQAENEAAVLARFMSKVNRPEDEGIGVAVRPLWKWHFGPQEVLLRPVGILMAASTVLFLIACANVANLSLARSTGRQREFSTRLALGASPGRLAGQLLVESLILAFAGSLLGLLATGWFRGALGWLLPSVASPAMVGAPQAGRVLVFTVLVAVVAALFSGVAPAIMASRSNVNEVLRGGGRSDAPGARSHRMRGLLVISEVALAVVALVGAGTFLRSYEALLAVAPGFAPEGQALAQFNLSTAGYSQAQADSFCQWMTGRLRRYPAITAVSYADTVPLGFYPGNWEDTEVEGYQPAPGENMKIYRNMVGPGYFDAMRIPMVEGRDFGLRDGPDSPNVAIVSQEFVRRFIPRGEPVGRRLHGWGRWFTIVGVVRDIKVHHVSEGASPFFYIPIRQVYRPEYGLTFHVRTTGPVQDAIAAVRREAAAFDPELTLFDAQPMSEYVSGSLFGQRVAASLLCVLGALGLILAAMGLYSVMAYSVAQRTGEIGIRMALGARPLDMVALVLRQGLGYAAAGLVIGTASALAMARMVSALLTGVEPAGPGTYLVAALFTLLVAAASVAIPSRRALGVDPMVAMRSQ